MNSIQLLFRRLAVLSIVVSPLIVRSAKSEMATVGVGDIHSSIAGSSPAAFQSMLETQLIKTNKVRVIERAHLEEILREKGLSLAGFTDGSGRISGIQGVGYLVYGTITKLGNTGQNVHFGNFALSSSKIEMAVDLKVVDASSGEILYADTVQETATGGQRTSIAGFQTGDKASDPLADVQRLTAKAITALIVTTIYPIKVIAIQEDGKVVVNYGDSVLTPGDQLKVFELGESFKDPDTGKVLGADEKEVALMQVAEANAKFSKATIVSGKVAIGNIARRISTIDAAKTASTTSTGGRLP